jgi:hypothetical protein
MAQKIKSKDEKSLISLTEATKYCNYSQEYLSLRARNKKLKSVKVGRNWMTTVGWLNEYLDRVDQYKEQTSSQPIENLVQGTTVVFADENAGSTLPDVEPIIETPAEPIIDQPVEVAPEEPVSVETPQEVTPEAIPQEEAPVEAPIEEGPEMPQAPSVPVETPKETDATVVSYKKEIAPPGNLPSEEELLKKYIPYEYPTQEGLRFGYVAAFTIVMVLAGITLGAGSFGVFFSDIKEYSSLVYSGSHTIGTDLAQYSSYSLSYSGQIFSQYINWLSSLLF